MIILIILFVGGFFALVILLAMGVLKNIKKAKTQARSILSEGKITNPSKYKEVKDMLSRVKNDTEAAYLWLKLEELSQK